MLRPTHTVQVFPNRLWIAMYVSEMERLGFEVHPERACEETSLAHDPICIPDRPAFCSVCTAESNGHFTKLGKHMAQRYLRDSQTRLQVRTTCLGVTQ